MSDIPAPADSIEITLGGKPATISMPYGLLLDITRLIPDAQAIHDMIGFDANLRDLVIRRLLTSTLQRAVKSEDELIPAEDVDISPTDASELASFAAEHAMHFFMLSATKAMEKLAKFQKMAPLLSPPSPTGSVN